MTRPCRFVVLSQARTGGTFVADLLNSHPEICCEGEILNPDCGHFPRALLPAARVLPYPFLAWRSRQARGSIYGCKIQVYDVRPLRLFLQCLVARHWRLIHLERSDVIGSTLSDLLAQKRGLWFRTCGEAPPTDVVELDPRQFQTELRRRLRLRRVERGAIAGLPHLHLVYETDVLDESALSCTTHRMLSFLGLPVLSLNSKLVPTDSRPREEVVANLAQLLDTLHKSDTAALLDEF